MPVSVQTLISSVANTGEVQAVVVLASVLLAVLAVSGVLLLMRYYLMERLQRQLYARLASWMAREMISPRARELSLHDGSMLVKRYFDIMTLKTHIPELLVGGVALLLQTVSGAVLVSFYHPLLMLFSVLLVLSIYLVWRVWGPTAMRSSVSLSHAKYDTADWLQQLCVLRAEDDPQAQVDRNELAKMSDTLVQRYIGAHKVHFRHHFSQVVVFALLYVVANAALLGLGGYLVILGELTLGQLVAAELIMSVILVNLGQFSVYFDKLYDIGAAAEEISLFAELASPTEG